MGEKVHARVTICYGLYDLLSKVFHPKYDECYCFKSNYLVDYAVICYAERVLAWSNC